MKHKLISRLAALLAAAMLFTGAAGALADAAADSTAQGETEATAEAEPTADARPEVDASVVATLGDIAITADETADLFSYVLEMYSYYGYDVTDESIRSELESITLDAIVASKVQEQMESELGFDQFTDEELAEFAASAQSTYDETWTSVYDSFDDGETGEAELKAQTQAELDKYGYTVDALLEQEKAEAAYNRLYEYLTGDVEVTDDDVAASYAETVAYDKELYADDPSGYTLQCMYGDRPAYTPEGIRTVKHILINYLDEDAQKISELEALSEKPDDYEQQYEALKQQAYANIKDKVDEVMAKIAAGEDFDALVEEYGEDPGMTTDPYKSEGYMVFDGCTNLVTEFVESAMALEQIGDVTAEPALTEYGAHIMLYFSDLAPGEVEMSADKAEEIRESLMDTKRNDAFNAAVDARRDELGELFLYPENLIEASYDEPAEAADEDAAENTLVIEG